MVFYAFSIVRDIDKAQDVVHDCFEKLLRKPDRWATITDTRAYLFRMVKNTSIIALRVRTAETRNHDRYRNHQLHLNHSTEEPEILKKMTHKENVRLTDKLLSLVTPRRRDVLQLVYLDENGYQQAADKLSISLNTLKTSIKKAKEHIIAKTPPLLPLILLAIY